MQHFFYGNDILDLLTIIKQEISKFSLDHLKKYPDYNFNQKRSKSLQEKRTPLFLFQMHLFFKRQNPWLKLCLRITFLLIRI